MRSAFLCKYVKNDFFHWHWFCNCCSSRVCRRFANVAMYALYLKFVAWKILLPGKFLRFLTLHLRYIRKSVLTISCPMNLPCLCCFAQPYPSPEIFLLSCPTTPRREKSCPVQSKDKYSQQSRHKPNNTGHPKTACFLKILPTIGQKGTSYI